MRQTSFSDELTKSVRVPQTLLVDALAQALVARCPDAAADARPRLLEVIGGALVDDRKNELSIPPLAVRRHAVRHPPQDERRSTAMKYMLLIYGDPTVELTPEAGQAEMNAYWEYEKAVAEAGVMLRSDALQGIETATTVEVRADGERVVTDGPFAETREVLGGHYVLDVPDLDAALDWAARCPGAQNGSRIEVRPIMEFDLP